MKQAERMIDQRLGRVREGINMGRDFDVHRTTFKLPNDLVREYRDLIVAAIRDGGGVLTLGSPDLSAVYYAIVGPPFQTGQRGTLMVPYKSEVQVIRHVGHLMVGSLIGQQSFPVGNFSVSMPEVPIPPDTYRAIKQWVVQLVSQNE